jgi:hypothetical protein
MRWGYALGLGAWRDDRVLGAREPDLVPEGCGGGVMSVANFTDLGFALDPVGRLLPCYSIRCKTEMWGEGNN